MMEAELSPADWVLVEAACVSYSIVTVPLYDTLGPDAVRYISNHAELRAVACSIALLPTLLPNLQACPSISLVVRPGCPYGHTCLFAGASCRGLMLWQR